MRYILFITVAVFTLLSCKEETDTNNQLSESEKRTSDSLSRIEQRRVADSLKKRNPLLIMPPDSTYTGDYIDKYENGIVKFKGFFRFGKRHGQWMSFYPNGTLWSEMHYDKGLKHGLNVAYYEDGETKRYEGYYKQDARDSVWCYYDTNGVIAEKVLFKKDRVFKKLPLK